MMRRSRRVEQGWQDKREREFSKQGSHGRQRLFEMLEDRTQKTKCRGRRRKVPKTAAALADTEKN